MHHILGVLFDHFGLLVVECEVGDWTIFAPEEGVFSADKGRRVHDLTHDDCDLIHHSLIHKAQVVLIVPEERTQNHQHGAGKTIETFTPSDFVQQLSDRAGEHPSQNGIVDQVMPETTRLLFGFVLLFLERQSSNIFLQTDDGLLDGGLSFQIDAQLIEDDCEDLLRSDGPQGLNQKRTEVRTYPFEVTLENQFERVRKGQH